MKKWIMATLAALALAGCGAPQSDEETVFDDQLETMDRARAVQDTLDQRAAEMSGRLGGDGDDEEEEGDERQ